MSADEVGALQTAPAAARNREPILAVLRDWLPRPGLLLEIASGTGEHAAWFAPELPDVTWQPSDIGPDRLASIAGWRATAGAANLLPPVPLDAARPATWPALQADAVLVVNLLHIAPFAATEGLMAGAARVLRPRGVLLIYGPFRKDGAHTAPSNAEFDATLRAQDPQWGVRDMEAVRDRALENGLMPAADIAMPANNRMLVFRAG